MSIDSREAQGFEIKEKVMTHKSILAHWVKIHSTILQLLAAVGPRYQFRSFSTTWCINLAQPSVCGLVPDEVSEGAHLAGLVAGWARYIELDLLAWKKKEGFVAQPTMNA